MLYVTEDLKCARKVSNDCRNISTISKYSKPILLQVSLQLIFLKLYVIIYK